MAKGAVKGSMIKNQRKEKQKLSLENMCVFVAGRNQTSDPEKDLKQQIGTLQARAYYTRREKRKGGMDAKIFGMVAWDGIKTALKGASKMFKMWHAKEGFGFCGVGYYGQASGKRMRTPGT